MPLWGFALIYAGVFVLFALLHYFSKNKKPVKRAFLSMLSGILVLICVNICGAFTKVYLPVSLLSVTTAAVGGIPGVTLMLALNMII